MTSLRTRRRLIGRLRDQGITDERVLSIMEETPGHMFIDEALSHKAYEDTALPIGHNQTISQPLVVALMTELVLDNDIPVKRVLEVGTGCGYQTAVLSQLVSWVFSVSPLLNRLLPLAIFSSFRFFRSSCRLSGFKAFNGW